MADVTFTKIDTPSPPSDVTFTPIPPEPHTTAAGLAGSATRGAAPYAIGAAAGAAAGAPFAGVGAVPGAMAGAGAVGLTQLATGLYDTLAPHLQWPKVVTPQEATDKVLDWIGVKRPSTGAERMTEAAAGGAAGGISGAAGAANVAERSSNQIVKAIAEQLGKKPVLQAVSGASGGVGAQGVAEAGGGPTAQLLGSLAFGSLPYGKAAFLASLKQPSTAEAKAAVANGYRFPPNEIAPLGEKSSLPASLLSGESGKIKLQQQASVDNQMNTNKLASEDIGLPAGTHLNERAFAAAKRAPSKVYQEVQAAVPEVNLAGDSAYQREVAGLGGKNSQVEKFFPEIGENPGILALRETMKRNEAVPTSVALKTVADLRFQAGQNLRAVGDAQKHALGLAQREAADAMEDSVERAVQKAPDYYAGKVRESLGKQSAATKAVTEANMKLTKAKADLATTSNIYAWAKAKKAEMGAQKELDAATEQRKAALDEYGNWSDRLKRAHDTNQANQTLFDRFRDARTKFAKIYNVEDATNRTTGNVNAAGIARAYNKGIPLTGKLKDIADAYNTAPKSMQNPSNFGRTEDWSATDFFGTALSMAAGHPGVAASILSRPVAKKLLLSPAAQGAMTSNQPSGPALPIWLNPGLSAVVPPFGSGTPPP